MNYWEAMKSEAGRKQLRKGFLLAKLSSPSRCEDLLELSLENETAFAVAASEDASRAAILRERKLLAEVRKLPRTGFKKLLLT